MNNLDERVCYRMGASNSIYIDSFSFLDFKYGLSGGREALGSVYMQPSWIIHAC